MRRIAPILLVTFFVFSISAVAASCDTVRSLHLPNVTIARADNVAAGTFTPPPAPVPRADARGGEREGEKGAAPPPRPNYGALPAFCRVAATLTPVSDSEIKIEVWLPESGWNGKLESVGNGAWAGSISYPAMATALGSGYAAASTDTGHTGNNANFITGHPEKVIDFGYRAVHEMTVAAKAIISLYYASGPKYSYWNGCSTGGRQALMEAQRYPSDYDGILAGAPAIYASRLQGMQVWASQTVHQAEASYIPPTKYPVIHDAVLRQCDALDGVKDGVLEDPKKCKFDPKVLACQAGDQPTCLTAPQVEAISKLYKGPRNSKTGQQLFPGLEPGSELGWNTLAGPQPMGLASDVYKYLVFENPNWDYKTINPTTDFPLAEKKLAEGMDAANANLKPFVDRGGKLIMYHGWSDPGIAPMNSVQYYKNVVDALGASQARNAVRLFMIPGMNHCQGGSGTDKFDGIGALAQWVEKGKTPEQINASHQTSGKIDRTRPLCPYPQVAAYKGSGSTDEAANFACK
jgi:feruloyl esterase